MEHTQYDKTFDSKDGDLMTVYTFTRAVEAGAFIDYDGFGYPVKDSMMAAVRIYPSQLEQIPEDATHILWFNR